MEQARLNRLTRMSLKNDLLNYRFSSNVPTAV